MHSHFLCSSSSFFGSLTSSYDSHNPLVSSLYICLLSVYLCNHSTRHRFPHRHILRSLCIFKDALWGTDSLKCQTRTGTSVLIWMQQNWFSSFLSLCMYDTEALGLNHPLIWHRSLHTGITSHFRLRAAVNACTVITVCLCPFVLQCLLWSGPVSTANQADASWTQIL